MATATQAAKNGAKTPTGLQPALRIIGRRESFWRAGFQFGLQARTLLLAELTEDQVKRLKAEPQLVVVETEVTAEELAGEKAASSTDPAA